MKTSKKTQQHNNKTAAIWARTTAQCNQEKKSKKKQTEIQHNWIQTVANCNNNKFI